MRLRAWREKRGLSGAEFARMTRRSQPSLWNIEAGLHKPSLSTALAIERATRGAIKASSWFRRVA